MVLKRSGEKAQPYLVFDFKKKTSIFLQLNIMLVVDFLVGVIYQI